MGVSGWCGLAFVQAHIPGVATMQSATTQGLDPQHPNASPTELNLRTWYGSKEFVEVATEAAFTFTHSATPTHLSTS